MGVLARRRPVAGSPDGAAAYDGLEGDRGRYPHLVGFLVDAEYSDGSPRNATGTITLSCDAGGLRVRLCDRDAGEVGFKTLESVVSFLKAVEGWLKEDQVEWRVDTYRTKKKK
jgi:hypothetical protein